MKVQLEFLNSSSERYDGGSSNEAIRLAVAVRALCHQSGTTDADPRDGEPNCAHDGGMRRTIVLL